MRQCLLDCGNNVSLSTSEAMRHCLVHIVYRAHCLLDTLSMEHIVLRHCHVSLRHFLSNRQVSLSIRQYDRHCLSHRQCLVVYETACKADFVITSQADQEAVFFGETLRDFRYLSLSSVPHLERKAWIILRTSRYLHFWQGNLGPVPN